MVNWCVTSKKFLFLCQSFSLAMLPFSSGSLDVKEDKIDALLGCNSQQQPTVASRPRNCILRVVRMLSKRAGKSPNKRISFNHIFKNYSKCRIWILAFSINFCPFKSDLFGNTIWLLSSGFPNLAGMDHFCHLSTQNVDVARSARNVESDIFLWFSSKHHWLWIWCSVKYHVHVEVDCVMRVFKVEMMRIRAQVTLESPLYLKGFKVISSLKTCWASKFKIR